VGGVQVTEDIYTEGAESRGICSLGHWERRTHACKFKNYDT